MNGKFEKLPSDSPSDKPPPPAAAASGTAAESKPRSRRLSWCGPRVVATVVVILLVLGLAACLLVFGDPGPSDEFDELFAKNGSEEEMDPQKAYIINSPTRCDEGYRYFRGKCRKVF